MFFPKRHHEAAMRVVFAAAWVGVAVWHGWLIGHDRLEFYNANDMPQRVLMSINASSHLGHLATSPRPLLAHVWPPGHFLWQGLIVKSFTYLYLRDLSTVLRAIQVASLAAFLLGVLAWRRAAGLRGGRLAGDVTGTLLLALPGLTGLAWTGLSEVYAFALTGPAVMWLARRPRRGWTAPLLAALTILLGTTVRTELVVIGAGGTLWLLMHRRWVAAPVFAAISGGYTAARMVYAYAELGGRASFLDWQRFYDWGPGAGILAALWRNTMHLNGAMLLGAALVAGAACLVWLPAVAPWRGRGAPGQLWRLGRRRVWLWPMLFVLITAALATLVLQGKINQQERYAIPSAAFALSVLGALGAFAWRRLLVRGGGWRLVTPVLLGGYVWVFFIGVGEARTLHQRLPADVRETVYWIKDQRPEHNNINMDFLMYWEQSIMLYALQPGTANWASCYSLGPRITAERPGWMRNAPPTKMGLRKTWDSHKHIELYRPPLAVLLSDARHEEAARTIGPQHGYHIRPSYLRPYLIEQADGSYRFVSPFFTSDLQVTFREAFANEGYRIMRLSYEEPAA